MKAKPKTKPTRIPLTAEHRKFFEACVLKWQRLLNLGDWRIGISVVPANGKKALAMVSHFDFSGRVASIRLAAEWDENNPPTPAYIEEIAAHEVLHIFLHELLQFTGNAQATDDDKMSAEHRVIQSLLVLMVPGVLGAEA